MHNKAWFANLIITSFLRVLACKSHGDRYLTKAFGSALALSPYLSLARNKKSFLSSVTALPIQWMLESIAASVISMPSTVIIRGNLIKARYS
jgi:hypothetical protein